MPSKSPAQARLMAAAAHDKKFAKKVGVPQDVAKDFNQADAGTGIIRPKEAVERIVAKLLGEGKFDKEHFNPESVQCGCKDASCPVHKGKSECDNEAEWEVGNAAMCDGCAERAPEPEYK